jgi:methyl-accepting chemotaxis protein
MHELPPLYKVALRIARSIGSPISIIVHTVVFVGIFSLQLFGYDLNEILLILTTAVSLEAIYLAIFIQMAVNATTVNLEAVQKDVEEIQEDVEDIQEDVEEISEDVEEISEDVEEISEDVEDISEESNEPNTKLNSELESLLKRVASDIETIKSELRKNKE